MKAAVVDGNNNIDIKNVPMPDIGPYEALVKINTCTICNGTDTSIIKNKFPRIGDNDYPAILGHESIGEIKEVGNKVKNFQKGDIVLRPMAVRPGETLDGYNSLWGGFAEYGKVFDYKAFKNNTPPKDFKEVHKMYHMQQIVPRNFNQDFGGILITFKECLSWLQRLGVTHKDSLLIIGTGVVSMAMIEAARFLGVHPIIVVGRRPEACERAMEFGAHYTINSTINNIQQQVSKIQKAGIDYVAIVVSDYSFLENGSKVLAENGTMAVYGIAPQMSANLKWDKVNWSIKFLDPDEPATHEQVIDAWKFGYTNFSKYISKKISLEDIEKGFNLIWEDHDIMKVIVSC